MPTPLTPTEVQAIRDGHAADKSCRAIAKDMGRSATAVAKYARDLGLAFDRSRTVEATKAKTADNRSKRATLEARLLDEAGLLLDQLHQEHLAFNFGGKDNDYNSETLPEPDVQSKRALVAAAGVAIDKALKLADADRDTTGVQAGKSMIGGLFLALHGTAPTEDELPADPTEADE